MNNPTYFEALKWASLLIQEHHGDENAPELIMMDRMEWNRTELLVHYRQQLRLDQWQQFQKDVQRAVNGEPVQYITNKANFYGREFYVDSRVLIPRVETEELVERILNAHPQLNQPLRVLDIGTGSGNIAITLKLERPDWQVSAVDIASEALTVAQQNAHQQEAVVDFRQGSLFDAVKGERFDIIVSNPPYIAENERDVMDQSVIEYEPDKALFAPDDGLFWYKQIGRQLANHLTNAGQLWCEFGYHQGAKLKQYFSELPGVKDVDVLQDLSGHDRILWVRGGSVI